MERRLRWRIPLKLWLISCFLLTLIFYALASFFTLTAVEKFGIPIEANPAMRVFMENFGAVWGLVILGTAGSTVIAAILVLLYKNKLVFPVLWCAHFVLTVFFFVSLNDSSLSFFKIFGFHPWNILFFLIFSFIITLLTTKKEVP